MSRATKQYILTIAGILCCITGLVSLKAIAEPQGVLQVLPYLCIGIGCGVFGHGTGEIAANRAYVKNPQLRKQMEIEKQDERNIAIANQAKAKAYDSMLYVLGAVMIAFALMNVQTTTILLLVGAYLLVVGVNVFYLNKYQKEQ